MPITNRNLPAGAVLVGRYKGQTYRCAVLENDGQLAYSLDDNSIHPSLSAAASKVMGGVSANGWRFWTPEAELNAATERPPATKKPNRNAVATKLVKVIKKLPNQKGVAEGCTKWWCSACMKGFVSEGSEMPEACPEGHAREQADEFANAPENPIQGE